MGNIKILPQSVVAKIAAGEVIERPASVVKELIENALDAAATHITVTIEESGIQKIQVIDNGIGMDEEDVRICCTPHATSKILHDEDLLSVTTLGFRGEALGSIAAVSDITIASRSKETTHGYKIEISEEKVSFSPIGMPVGTRITIENVFAYVPARKAFLKQPRTEWQHILHVVTSFAVIFPQIGFTLTHNGKLIFDVASQELLARITQLLGSTISSNLIPISGEYVTGFIGTPQIGSQSTLRQFISINNRIVSHKSISRSLRQAFGTLLLPKIEPVAILSFHLPAEHIDVNIHPRKETVRLQYVELISKDLYAAVRNALETARSKYRIGDFVDEDAQKMNPYMAKILRDQGASWDPCEKSTNNEILQLHNLYLITETNHGILMVDQHAAHERILYEEFVALFEAQKSNPKQVILPSPHIVTLPPAEADKVDEVVDAFIRLGFTLTVNGQTIEVQAIPHIFQGKNIERVLVDVVTDLESDSREIDPATHKTLSYLACRSAIKTGDYLSSIERINLLEKLSQTKTKYTCPHGRPTHIEVHLNQLHTLFKRI